MAAKPRSSEETGRWARGPRTDELERATIRRLLGQIHAERLLDVGSGTGRLTSTWLENAAHVVSLDIERAYLLDRPKEAREDRVRAEMRRLPFRDSTFSVVGAIRVVHRVPDLLALLRELRRVLAPSGRLVLSYSPRPSLKTLEFDIAARVRYGRSEPALTFLREPVSVVPSGAGQGHNATRSAMGGLFTRAGFVVESEIPRGLEEVPGARRLPRQFFERAEHLRRASWLFPTWFVRLRPG